MVFVQRMADSYSNSVDYLESGLSSSHAPIPSEESKLILSSRKTPSLRMIILMSCGIGLLFLALLIRTTTTKQDQTLLQTLPKSDSKRDSKPATQPANNPYSANSDPKSKGKSDSTKLQPKSIKSDNADAKLEKSKTGNHGKLESGHASVSGTEGSKSLELESSIPPVSSPTETFDQWIPDEPITGKLPDLKSIPFIPDISSHLPRIPREQGLPFSHPTGSLTTAAVETNPTTTSSPSDPSVNPGQGWGVGSSDPSVPSSIPIQNVPLSNLPIPNIPDILKNIPNSKPPKNIPNSANSNSPTSTWPGAASWPGANWPGH